MKSVEKPLPNKIVATNKNTGKTITFTKNVGKNIKMVPGARLATKGKKYA